MGRGSHTNALQKERQEDRARNRRPRGLGAVLGLALLLSAAPLTLPSALAQEPETAAADTADRMTAETARDEAAAAQSRTIAGGREVSYPEILADPDNLDLNVAYARTLIGKGDLKGASATLDRILLIAPDQAQVRVLLGLVLYRLRELSRAEEELELALKSPLPDVARTAWEIIGIDGLRQLLRELEQHAAP